MKLNKFILTLGFLLAATFNTFKWSWADCPEKECTETTSVEPPASRSITDIQFEEFQQWQKRLEKCIIFDVRPKESYDGGHIPGAQSWPLNDIAKETKASSASRIFPDKKIIVYCASRHCGASHNAAQILSNFGYEILDYKGGIQEWMEKGKAVEK